MTTTAAAPHLSSPARPASASPSASLSPSGPPPPAPPPPEASLTAVDLGGGTVRHVVSIGEGVAARTLRDLLVAVPEGSVVVDFSSDATVSLVFTSRPAVEPRPGR